MLEYYDNRYYNKNGELIFTEHCTCEEGPYFYDDGQYVCKTIGIEAHFKLEKGQSPTKAFDEMFQKGEILTESEGLRIKRHKELEREAKSITPIATQPLIKDSLKNTAFLTQSHEKQ